MEKKKPGRPRIHEPKPAQLDKEDHRRRIKHEVHVATGCFFTKEELERLKKIKSAPDWRPASERNGERFGRGARTVSPRMLKIFRDEFERITMEDAS